MDDIMVEYIKNDATCRASTQNTDMVDGYNYSIMEGNTKSKNDKFLDGNENIVGSDENVAFNSQISTSSAMEKPRIDLDNTTCKNKHRDVTITGGPFEYGSNYGYLYTKLRFILDSYDISDPLKNDLYSLLEIIGEMRILGVYSEHYKKYRRALDTYTLKLDSSFHINEDTVGELRYLSFQNSASGRRELRLIDKFIKEWKKKDKEKKLLQSCRGAMSDWLNKSELGTSKNDSSSESLQDVFNYILDSMRGSNNSLQTNLLTFLSESYVLEKLYPYISNQLLANSSENQTPIFNGHLNKDQGSAVSSSLSSIEVGEGAVGAEPNLCKDKSSFVVCDSSGVEQTNNDNLINNKTMQNESVIDWIKNNFRKQNNSECIGTEIQEGERVDKNQSNELKESETIVYSRIRSAKSMEIYDIISPSVNSDFVSEYCGKFRKLYAIFLSMREKTIKRRRYYKSIPMIGSNKFKKQSISDQEVRLRQHQVAYNCETLPEVQNQIRRVLIYRSEWKRPPMFLLLTHQGKVCNGLNPSAKEEHINYDIDTDEEWEEQFGGEDVDDIDEGIDNGDDDDDNEAVASGWLVPDGCFQSDELLDDIAISTAENCDTNIVNLLSVPSQYQAPVVISFLGHKCTDFGAGISIPSDSSVTILINEYSINFPQGLNWVYSKTYTNKNDKDFSPCESNSIYTKGGLKHPRNSVKLPLDDSMKCDLLYFVYGKYSPLRKIIDDFISLNTDKNLKRSSIIKFLKGSVHKTKMNADCKPRWYINDNLSEPKLNEERLDVLLKERSIEEGTDSCNAKAEFKDESKIKPNVVVSQYPNPETFIGVPHKRRCPEECGKVSKPELFEIDLNGGEAVQKTEKTPNYENYAYGSQKSDEERTSVRYETPYQQGVYMVNNHIHIFNDDNVNGNKKKRKYSNKNKETPKNSDISFLNQERNKIEVELNGNKLGIIEQRKSSAPINRENSLITQFFTLRNKDN